MRSVLFIAANVALTCKSVNFTNFSFLYQHQRHILSLLSIYHYHHHLLQGLGHNEDISYVLCLSIVQTYLINSECRNIKLSFSLLNKWGPLSTKCLEVYYVHTYIRTYVRTYVKDHYGGIALILDNIPSNKFKNLMSAFAQHSLSRVPLISLLRIVKYDYN
jgi:hypothetical protein